MDDQRFDIGDDGEMLQEIPDYAEENPKPRRQRKKARRIARPGRPNRWMSWFMLGMPALYFVVRSIQEIIY